MNIGQRNQWISHVANWINITDKNYCANEVGNKIRNNEANLKYGKLNKKGMLRRNNEMFWWIEFDNAWEKRWVIVEDKDSLWSN